MYARFDTDALRIEFEFHSSFLRRHGINHPADFANLATILRSHIVFAKLNEKKLVPQLQRNGSSEQEIQNILGQMEDRDEWLYDVLRYLRQRVSLQNVRRVLVPLDEMNQIVRNATKRWAAQWADVTGVAGETE